MTQCFFLGQYLSFATHEPDFTVTHQNESDLIYKCVDKKNICITKYTQNIYNCMSKNVNDIQDL